MYQNLNCDLLHVLGFRQGAVVLHVQRLELVLTAWTWHYVVVWQAYRLCLPQLKVWAGGAMNQWFLYLVPYQNAVMCKLEHNWFTPSSILSIHTADNSVLLYCFSFLWALCQAVILLTYIAATKIGSCELDLLHVVHILSFITPNFFPICLRIMETLAVFQAWIWVWVVIGKC